MSAPEDYERGYYGHGRGLVVTQPRPGEFDERPMTAGELAARQPAWAIGADIYKFTEGAAFAYIRCWEIIAPVIEAAVDAAEREAAIWRDAYHTHYARAEALALELRRIHDGQPDGHQRPRPLGLVSDEPVTGD